MALASPHFASNRWLAALFALSIIFPINRELFADNGPILSSSRESGDVLHVESARLKQLLNDISLGNKNACSSFWQEIDSNGAPLVELNQQNPEQMDVTFLWKQANPKQTAVLYSTVLNPNNARENQLLPLAGTDILYKTVSLPNNLRTTYFFSINDPHLNLEPGQQVSGPDFVRTWQHDPLNPSIVTIPSRFIEAPSPGPTILSVLELPQAPAQKYQEPQAKVPKGNLERHELTAGFSHKKRQVLIYTPAGYERVQPKKNNLILFLDGDAYHEIIPTTTILDNMIAAKAIPPTVAIFLGNIDQETRHREFSCDTEFTRFIAQELMPWAVRKYDICQDPQKIAIAGTGFGALAATFVALRHPEIFGNVLAQSAPYSWLPNHGRTADKKGIIFDEYEKMPKLPITFYIEIGNLEKWPPYNALEANRSFRDLLQGKGYPLCYVEHPGGHDWVSWQGTLPDGIRFLFHSRQADDKRAVPID